MNIPLCVDNIGGTITGVRVHVIKKPIDMKEVARTAYECHHNFFSVRRARFSMTPPKSQTPEDFEKAIRVLPLHHVYGGDALCEAIQRTNAKEQGIDIASIKCYVIGENVRDDLNAQQILIQVITNNDAKTLGFVYAYVDGILQGEYFSPFTYSDKEKDMRRMFLEGLKLGEQAC